MGKNIKRNLINGVVPFYANPELDLQTFASCTSRVLHTIAYLGRYHHVTLVDDGETLRGRVDISGVVSTVTVIPHSGKAGAVRSGIQWALNSHPEAQYIIQSDYDGDPSPIQAKALVQVLLNLGISGDKPAMVLGERDLALEKGGYLDEHRFTLFALQRNFCELLGYPGISDITTGLRVYTRSLAEGFINLGRARNFGSDVEQIVIARLLGAAVFPHKLIRARKRPNRTQIDKFTDCLETLNMYTSELSEAGLQETIDVFGNISLTGTNAISTNEGKYTLLQDGDSLKGIRV